MCVRNEWWWSKRFEVNASISSGAPTWYEHTREGTLAREFWSWHNNLNHEIRNHADFIVLLDLWQQAWLPQPRHPQNNPWMINRETHHICGFEPIRRIDNVWAKAGLFACIPRIEDRIMLGWLKATIWVPSTDVPRYSTRWASCCWFSSPALAADTQLVTDGDAYWLIDDDS